VLLPKYEVPPAAAAAAAVAAFLSGVVPAYELAPAPDADMYPPLSVGAPPRAALPLLVKQCLATTEAARGIVRRVPLLDKQNSSASPDTLFAPPPPPPPAAFEPTQKRPDTSDGDILSVAKVLLFASSPLLHTPTTLTRVVWLWLLPSLGLSRYQLPLSA